LKHHRNAIHDTHTLHKDLPSDDPDTLTYHSDKLKKSQDALGKSPKTKKQDKLLATVVQDTAHDAESADHQKNSMLDSLKKCKNNHSTSSLPQKTRSNACNVKRIWKQRLATLDPLEWHALDLPWATTCSNTHLHFITRRMQETPLNSFQEWKNKPLMRQQLHILCSWHPSLHPTNSKTKQKCSRTNHCQGPLESLIKCYKPVTLTSKPLSSSSLMAYGNPKHNPQPWQQFLLPRGNLFTKGTTRISQTHCGILQRHMLQ